MTDQEQVSGTPEVPGRNAVEANRTFDVVETTLDRFLATADQSRAIGEPITHGEQLIIPTAEVVAGMGFGIGGGGAQGEEPKGGGFGIGGGGGGNAFSRPVAIIVAGPEGVEVKPVFDITKIALTALTALGFMIATIGSFRRGPHV